MARALVWCKTEARQRGTVWTYSRASLRQQRGLLNTCTHTAGTAEPSCAACSPQARGLLTAGAKNKEDKDFVP